jgi:hypothetical protein
MTQHGQASAYLAVQHRFSHPKLPMAQEVRVSSISVSFRQVGLTGFEPVGGTPPATLSPV